MRVSTLADAFGADFVDGVCIFDGVTFATVIAANFVAGLAADFGTGFAGTLVTDFGAGFALAFTFTNALGAGLALAATFGVGLALTLTFALTFIAVTLVFFPTTFALVFAFAVTNVNPPETTLSSFCGRSKKRRKHKNA